MNFLKITLTTLGLMVAVSPALKAEVDDPITLEFRCLALNNPLPGGVYTQPTGGEPIRIYTNAPTDQVQYEGPNPIVFYQDGPKDESGKPVRVPIARYDAADAPAQPLLLFSKPDASNSSYTVQAIDNNLQSAPPGSFRLFNLTEKDIFGVIANQRFRIDAGQSAFTQVSQTGDIEVVVQLAENADGEPKRLYASSWTYSPHFRYLVFIMPSDYRTRGNIAIRLISDLVR